MIAIPAGIGQLSFRLTTDLVNGYIRIGVSAGLWVAHLARFDVPASVTTAKILPAMHRIGGQPSIAANLMLIKKQESGK